MEREIRDEIVESVILDLAGEVPDVICVSGGDYEVRNYIMRELSFKVGSRVTDRVLEDKVYSVDLDSF